MRESLEKRHLWVVAETKADAAKQLLEKQLFHVCVWAIDSDARATEEETVGPIFHLKQSRPATAIIVTNPGSSSSFVDAAMRAGASHYWVKDASLAGFDAVVTETLARTIPDALSADIIDFPIPHFIGRHPLMLQIFQLIQSIKATDSTVLITGESGTGKEVVARAIHNLSPRRKHPFVAVNCGAIPPSLLESELFGHMKGSFTGASANRIGRFQLAGTGTLFLDEIGDLPVDLQAKILRAIQNRQFEPVGSAYSLTLEARIIAATNTDLESAVAEKRFREDLFYRLNVIPLHIPPLRARKSDVPFLVRAFLENFCKVNSKEFAGISEEAMQFLMSYHWPGNVRELENLMERVVVLKRSAGIIDVKDLPIQQFKRVQLDRFVANVALPDDGIDLNEAVNDLENEFILQALQRTNGNKNRAAALLNLNRTTLVEKLKRKGLRIAS